MKFCHVFHPYIHTDRPRCYALMREDYLWSPLQSACSMQHLRSVPSLGRQCGPPPTLACPLPPLPTTCFWITFPVLFLLRPLFHLLPRRYPEWCVRTFTLTRFLKPLISLHANLPWKSLHHTLPLGAHTLSRNTRCQKGKPQQRKTSQHFIDQPEGQFLKSYENSFAKTDKSILIWLIFPLMLVLKKNDLGNFSFEIPYWHSRPPIWFIFNGVHKKTWFGKNKSKYLFLQKNPFTHKSLFLFFCYFKP